MCNFYFREEAEVSAARGNSPVPIPAQRQRKRQKASTGPGGPGNLAGAQLLRGARGLGDVCTSGASVAGCRVVAGGVGRKALAAEAGTPGTVFPPAANGTA